MTRRQTTTLRGVVVAGWLGDAASIEDAWAAADPALRAAAVAAWQRCGLLTDGRLIAALADPEASVRRRAAECAAAPAVPSRTPGGDRTALVAALVTATEDEDPDVTDAACFALGEIDDRSRAVVSALEQVAAGHDEPLCRESAVAALGAIGDPASLEVVLAACRDKATIRRRAALALAAFDDPRATAMLEEMSSDRDWQVRQAAEDLTAPPAD